MADEENYDPLEIQRIMDGAYRRIDAVIEDTYDKLESQRGMGDTIERHRDDIDEAIEMVESLPSAVHEGEDLVYSEEDLCEATQGLNKLENIYRHMDVSDRRPIGSGAVVRNVADTIRSLEHVLDYEVLRPARDYGKLEPLDLE